MVYCADASSLGFERKICSAWLQRRGGFSTSYAPPTARFEIGGMPQLLCWLSKELTLGCAVWWSFVN